MKLSEYLKYRNLSQTEFAKDVGISDQMVCDYLATPRRRGFSPETAAKIEKATGGLVTFVELIHPDFRDAVNE